MGSCLDDGELLRVGACTFVYRGFVGFMDIRVSDATAGVAGSITVNIGSSDSGNGGLLLLSSGSAKSATVNTLVGGHMKVRLLL